MNDKKVDKKRKNNGGEPTTTAPDPTVPNRAHTEMKADNIYPAIKEKTQNTKKNNIDF